MITSLKPNEIFVFGSNLAGIHGAGAAKQAYEKFGAVWSIGFGKCGQSYAIPTKDRNIKSLSLSEIDKYVCSFLTFATVNPHLTFLVTAIGCGLAGYKYEEIAPMFKGAPNNVVLPEEFKRL